MLVTQKFMLKALDSWAKGFPGIAHKLELLAQKSGAMPLRQFLA